jgi:hypothetical protein
MARCAAKSPNRRTPKKASRTISSVHRSPTTSSALAREQPSRATTGSAVLNMARQVGSAVGVAVVVVILGTSATHTVTDFHHVWAAEALAGLVACLSIAVTAGHGARARTRSA